MQLYNRPMRFRSIPKRWLIALIGAGVLAFLVLLGAMQAFNTSGVRFLSPETSGETLALTGLTVLVFLLLMTLLVLLFRTLLKLYAGQSHTLVGARLRSRMVMGAALIAITPAVFMFLFCFELMNRSLDRWFSPNISELREDSSRVALELGQYVASNARGEAEAMAQSPALEAGGAALTELFQNHRITLDGGFVFVYGRDGVALESFQPPADSGRAEAVPWIEDGEQQSGELLSGPFPDALFRAVRRNDQPIIRMGADEFALGMATTATGKTVVAGLPMPRGLSLTTGRIRSGATAYWNLYRSRRRIRTIFMMMLLLITAFVFFTSVWMALFLSKQITRPVEALAESMAKISDGEYGHRVELEASAEMGDLVRAFNHMASDLDASRQLAESSSIKLTAANLALEERRRELETILETIPSGVLTLDSMGRILQSNRAFAALMGRDEEDLLWGEDIETIFPAECLEDLKGVIRRGQRMGAAFTEVETGVRGRMQHLAITSARLNLSSDSKCTVLVVEDTSELLRAQRQMAWKEVAQRVAHEIKNPLTPISLSAERIGRMLDRGQSDSNILRKCSGVILNCVGTLRTLVDQFSTLAQFPMSQPRACNLNEIAEQALALFADRLEGVTVEWGLEPELPQVMVDPEGVRRALANLVDNAVEAMQGSLLRILAIRTAFCEEANAVELIVADTGHGITDEIRERLFLPFYSTKHRGTGLGLSIAAKVVQEHGGSLRAESNAPKGARFIVRFPVAEAAPELLNEAGAATRAEERQG